MPAQGVNVLRMRPSSAGQGMGARSGDGSSGMRVKRMSGYYEDGSFVQDFRGESGDGGYAWENERFGSGNGNGNGSGGSGYTKERKGSLSIDIGVARGLGALLGGGGNNATNVDRGSQSAVEEGNEGAGDGKRKWLSLRRH
jgi:hypothetical protein